MKIKLKKGKQRELILLAKNDKNWKEFAKLVNISEKYLCNDLKNEKILISEMLYLNLCKISNKNFDEFIIERLDNNWGKSKGGKISRGNTKDFKEPKESLELAELIGIILGDGHVEKLKIGSKIRCYSIVVTGDSRHDKKYLIKYVNNLFKKLFNENGRILYSKDKNSIYIKLHGKKIVDFIESKGVFGGNKKRNNQGIPKWILINDSYLKATLRGLIDTDGCIYYISKNNRNLRISFTSYIPNLMNDVRNSFLKLGFNPSEIIRCKDITISRKEDIKKYLKEIGFSNDKHLKRYQNLVQYAPIV
ncbi:MAG: LAGLIDADG family homing endonuclease [Candidatus Pacearchaeota archaeon]